LGEAVLEDAFAIGQDLANRIVAFEMHDRVGNPVEIGEPLMSRCQVSVQHLFQFRA